jgi:hypothetical protein
MIFLSIPQAAIRQRVKAMKRNFPSEQPDRFSGSLRHYHRSGSQTQRSWDDWVDGDLAKKRRSRNWPKVIGITLGGLALAGIIAGLLVELG